MTDLIKNEAEFLRNCATDIETGEPLYEDEYCNLYVIDAHRIADLIEDLEERNKELALQLLAVHGQAADALDKLTKAEKNRDGYLAERNKFQLYLQRTHADWELEVAAVDALTAKLAKAVELALEECPFRAGTPKYDKWWHHRRDVLAELEGKND